MFIEFHIEGLETPQLVEISKASRFAAELEMRGKDYRLGKTLP